MSLVADFDGVLGKGAPTPGQIAKHVAERYLGIDRTGAGDEFEMVSTVHVKRRRAMARRLRFYRDEYHHDVERLIDEVFDNETVRGQRKKFADIAMGMNVTRRLIDEMSAVYDKPAVRTFRKDEVRTGQLRTLEDDLEIHDLMQTANALTNLCNEIMFWRVPSIRILTPDVFDLIAHPMDPLRVSGVLLHWGPAPEVAPTHGSRVPHYALWDESVVYLLDASGRYIRTEGHGWGRIPGVLVHRRKPLDQLLDPTSGGDIVAAHRAVVLLNLMALKLGKSAGENQPILKGPLANVAAGQPMDGETPVSLPPDVDLDVLSLRTDPEHYLKMVRHFVGGVAANYGMSYEQFMFQETTDSTSGRAYKVRREKLTEMRRQQAKRWRRTERLFWELMGVSTDGLEIDFQEIAVPSDASEEFELYKAKMREGLDNPLAFLRRQDPDLTRDGALEVLKDNLIVNANVIDMLRSMNMSRDANVEDPGKSPEENGADNESEEDDE